MIHQNLVNIPMPVYLYRYICMDLFCLLFYFLSSPMLCYMKFVPEATTTSNSQILLSKVICNVLRKISDMFMIACSCFILYCLHRMDVCRVFDLSTVCRDGDFVMIMLIFQMCLIVTFTFDNG